MSRQEVYFKTEIIERPCKANELTAIIRAEYQSERSKISDFGYADTESTKSKSPKKIMDIARNEALERVKKEAMWATTHNTEIAANSEAKTRETASQPVTQQAQNPRKTASQKQIDLLITLTGKLKLTLNFGYMRSYYIEFIRYILEHQVPYTVFSRL